MTALMRDVCGLCILRDEEIGDATVGMTTFGWPTPILKELYEVLQRTMPTNEMENVPICVINEDGSLTIELAKKGPPCRSR